jgi:hypothetical protein
MPSQLTSARGSCHGRGRVPAAYFHSAGGLPQGALREPGQAHGRDAMADPRAGRGSSQKSPLAFTPAEGAQRAVRRLRVRSLRRPWPPPPAAASSNSASRPSAPGVRDGLRRAPNCQGLEMRRALARGRWREACVVGGSTAEAMPIPSSQAGRLLLARALSPNQAVGNYSLMRQRQAPRPTPNSGLAGPAVIEANGRLVLQTSPRRRRARAGLAAGPTSAPERVEPPRC